MHIKFYFLRLRILQYNAGRMKECPVSFSFFLKKKKNILTSWKPFRGSLPFVATLVNRELWNQPRCWSVPSRYKSAGKWRQSFVPKAAAQEEPAKINKTSKKNQSDCKATYEKKNNGALSNRIKILLARLHACYVVDH